jgi:hypothetical protein
MSAAADAKDEEGCEGTITRLGKEPTIDVMPSEERGDDLKFKALPYHKILPKPPFTMRVLGTIGAGKTSFVWTMVNKLYKDYWDEVIVYQGSKDSVKVWPTIPQKRVIVLTEWDGDEFNSYFKALEEHQVERQEKGLRLLNVAVVFDDMIAARCDKVSAGGKSVLQDLIARCRHPNVSVIIATQDSKVGTPPGCRNQMMYNVIFRMQTNDLAKLAEDSCGCLDPKEFMRVYWQEVGFKPHAFLLIDFKAPLQDQIRRGFSTILHPFSKKLNELTKGHIAGASEAGAVAGTKRPRGRRSAARLGDVASSASDSEGADQRDRKGK